MTVQKIRYAESSSRRNTRNLVHSLSLLASMAEWLKRPNSTLDWRIRRFDSCWMNDGGRCSDARLFDPYYNIYIYKALFCNARSLFEATPLRALRTGVKWSSSTLIWWKSSLHPRLSLSIGLSPPISLIIIRIFALKLPCHSDWKGLYQLELD